MWPFDIVTVSGNFVCTFSFGFSFFFKFTPSPFEGFINEICWLPYLNKNEDWEAGGSPVAECMLSMHEALNSIPITKKKRKRRMKIYFPNIIYINWFLTMWEINCCMVGLDIRTLNVRKLPIVASFCSFEALPFYFGDEYWYFIKIISLLILCENIISTIFSRVVKLPKLAKRVITVLTIQIRNRVSV